MPLDLHVHLDLFHHGNVSSMDRDGLAQRRECPSMLGQNKARGDFQLC